MNIKDYEENRELTRAEAIRAYQHLKKQLLSPWHTVEQINKAFKIKKQYNL